jgi:hypothetical protein
MRKKERKKFLLLVKMTTLTTTTTTTTTIKKCVMKDNPSLTSIFALAPFRRRGNITATISKSYTLCICSRARREQQHSIEDVKEKRVSGSRTLTRQKKIKKKNWDLFFILLLIHLDICMYMNVKLKNVNCFCMMKLYQLHTAYSTY